MSYEAWWKCKKNHSWPATVNRRTSQGTGCPYCSGRLAIKGENDLATTHPEVLKEWDFEKMLSRHMKLRLEPTKLFGGFAVNVIHIRSQLTTTHQAMGAHTVQIDRY